MSHLMTYSPAAHIGYLCISSAIFLNMWLLDNNSSMDEDLDPFASNISLVVDILVQDRNSEKRD